jgi:hypothetical protein
MICNPKMTAMKTNSTLIVVIRILAFILLCLYSLLVFGQKEVAQNKILPTVTKVQATESVISSFEGTESEEKIRLVWTLTDNNNASSVLVEKSYNGEDFQYVVDFWVNLDGNKTTNFRYSDAKKSNKQVHYRLKITDANGNVQYSNTLFFGKSK